MTFFYSDPAVALHHGDSLEVMQEMPSESVNCIVTSPPYYSQRDYEVEGQYGLEESPDDYIKNLRQVFAEAQRVLVKDGSLWLNLGDSRYAGRGTPGPNSADRKQRNRKGWRRPLDQTGQPWARPKALLGIPWRLADALAGDGWIIRNAIIWRKTNPVPDPTRDRFPATYETVFLAVKSRFYHFDRDEARKYGEVWDIAAPATPHGHPAPMAPEVIRRCIEVGSKLGDVVLDPFAGSCTTGQVALDRGRRFVGIDLRKDYLELGMRTRLALRDHCPSNTGSKPAGGES